jgi:hypothetical protein
MTIGNIDRGKLRLSNHKRTGYTSSNFNFIIITRTAMSSESGGTSKFHTSQEPNRFRPDTLSEHSNCIAGIGRTQHKYEDTTMTDCTFQ